MNEVSEEKVKNGLVMLFLHAKSMKEVASDETEDCMPFDALYGSMLGKEAALWDFPEPWNQSLEREWVDRSDVK